VSYTQRLSDRAYSLILKHEVGGGVSYYNAELKRPTWPKGASGVTVGIGYDLGYHTREEIRNDWQAAGLEAYLVYRLEQAAGIKGREAERACSQMQDVEISWERAWWVFNERTLPKYIRQTLRAFPDAHLKLSADGFGALVSLVFNRGTSMGDPNDPKDRERRKEMRNIQVLLRDVPAGPWLNDAMATQIRRMKRLWQDTGQPGLLRRREDEAAMFDGGVR